MEKELPIKIITLYFLAKIVFGIVGILLFLLHIVWPSQLMVLFGDLSIYRASVVYVGILIVFYALVAYGLSIRHPLSRMGVIVLLVVDFFIFPVGTIVASAMIIYLLTPYAAECFKPISPQHLPFRAIGMVVVAVSLVGFVVTTGLFAGFGEAVGGYPASTTAFSIKIQDVEEAGEVDVIVELTGSMAQAVSQQNVVMQEITTLGGEVTDRVFRTINALRVSIDATQLQPLAVNPNVDRIVPVEFYVFPVDWDRQGILPQLEESSVILDVDKLWDMGYTGDDIVIAVVDTGINEDMKWLQRDGQSVVIDSYELYDDWVHWHGTACASCIASQNPEYLGMAPDADLLDVEVFLPSGAASNWDIIKGWEWVANWKARTGRFVICTNSFGAPPQYTGCGGWDRPCIMCEAANNMVLNHNIPMVIAAGNHYPNENPRVNCPGQSQYALTVGATDDDNVIASFSNIGPTTDGKRKPDVVAPGVRINTFDDRGNMIAVSGTSFSTPLTAGVLACIVEGNTEYGGVQYGDAVREGAKDLGPSGFDYSYGYGLVDGDGVLNALEGEMPQGSYGYIFGILPFVGVGIATYPEWSKRRRLI
ncbi:hypothetical protein ES703_79828 [subsurface metagenome]